MPDKEIMEIAEKAFMIVNGYAFSKKNENISVLNLNNPNSAMLLSKDGKMLETNMQPIEQALVLNYWRKNAILMEDGNA